MNTELLVAAVTEMVADMRFIHDHINDPGMREFIKCSLEVAGSYLIDASINR
jgi:hypothetical protein